MGMVFHAVFPKREITINNFSKKFHAFSVTTLGRMSLQVELNPPTLASKAPSTFVSLANFEKFFMQQVKEQSFRVFFALFSLTAASDYSHQLGPQTLEAPKK
jgi:hypothetical protein